MILAVSTSQLTQHSSIEYLISSKNKPFVNLRHACARVTVLVLCVCVCVSLHFLLLCFSNTTQTASLQHYLDFKTGDFPKIAALHIS